MIEINNNVKVYATIFEDEAYKQVERISSFNPYKNSKIRIMPDAHAGKGCVVGTTMTIADSITPNLVGVDIGCGMLAAKISNKNIDLQKLDDIIHKFVPNGFAIHDKPIITNTFNLENLYCANTIDIDYALRSIGSLGGGNHFIELNKNSNGEYIIVIHSGSRNLGVQVCNYYQKIASENKNKYHVKELIQKLKSEGREKEIQSEIQKFNSSQEPFDKELAHLTGTNFYNYLHDMEIVQNYASQNRWNILRIICEKMNIQTYEFIETIHNYIDIKNMILRKGAVSANLGEKLIIPMNMRDGSLICVGKGNPDWNYSAPHGAGRLMSRSKAKENITMDEFENSMSNVFTTSVCEETLDEAPQAYKPMEEIIPIIQDTVEILEIIKPVYNFKSKN